MSYVDGFVVVVPKTKLAEYRKLARKASKVWMDLGAVAYQECVAEDLDAPCGVPYTKLMKLKPDETVVFAWIQYKNRAHRDRTNKLIMTDPRLAKMMTGEPPFDMKRMAYGGFKTIVTG